MPGQTLAQMVRAKYPGAYDDLNDQALEAAFDKKYPGAYDDLPRSSTVNQVTAKSEDFTPQPEGSAFSRMVSGFAQRVLPSTTLSDYWQGPAYALQHPLDSAGLLFGAAKDAAVDQGGKAKEAAGRVLTAPTLGGKVGAASEALGHGAAAAIPFVGPAAANVGEQIASGDVAGGIGGAAGLLAPFGAAKAVNAVRPMVSNAFAKGNVTRMEQALAATTNENKTRAARVAPQMVERGIWNKDLKSLEGRAAMESEKAGKAVEAEVTAVASKQVDVLPLVEELEKAKASAVDTNAKGERVIIEPNQVKAIESLQDTLMQYGDQISIESMNKVRRKWDEVVQASKGFTNPDVGWQSWAAREGRSVLRDELSNASPNIDAVMAEYSFWQNIEDISHATNKRRVGQNGSLLPTIAASGGAVVADAMGGGGLVSKTVGVVTGAKLAASLKRLIDSPGWKMFTAVQRNRIADAVAAGDVGVIDAAARGGFLGNRVNPAPVGATPFVTAQQPTPDDARASR